MKAIIKSKGAKIEVELQPLTVQAFKVYHNNILVGTLQGGDFYPINLIGAREFHNKMGFTYSIEIINQ